MQPWSAWVAGARPSSIPSRAKAAACASCTASPRSPNSRANWRRKHGFRLSIDLKDAIADPQVQAIMLATPHSLHVEQVRMVAAAGKPVWCEKPLALTRTEAERAVAAVRAANVPLGSGNNKRCFASMRELKRVVDSGEIGKVLHIEGHFSNEHSTRVSGGWRDDPAESPGAGMTGAGPARARCLRQSGRADLLCRCALHHQEVAARSARRGGRAGGVCRRRHRPDGHGARRAGVLALRRVRHGWLRGSARRGHVDRRQDRRADGREDLSARRFAAHAAGSLRRRDRGQGAVSGAAGADARRDRRLRGDHHLARQRRAGEAPRPPAGARSSCATRCRRRGGSR